MSDARIPAFGAVSVGSFDGSEPPEKDHSGHCLWPVCRARAGIRGDPKWF